jgi:hypothetical protein
MATRLGDRGTQQRAAAPGGHAGRGVVAALDAFTELAAALTATAERDALEQGRWLLGNRRAAA